MSRTRLLRAQGSPAAICAALDTGKSLRELETELQAVNAELATERARARRLSAEVARERAERLSRYRTPAPREKWYMRAAIWLYGAWLAIEPGLTGFARLFVVRER